MIVGISGKIGSGKDTVGEIIQFLNYCRITKVDTDEVELILSCLGDNNLSRNRLESISGWEIKKYADKLKDTVCLLIGCTREQLEDREFKEKELGEEWSLYWYTDGLGKKYLTLSEEVARMEHKRDFGKEILTPRKILQLLGTEAGREIIHPNIWVNSLFADYISPVSFMCDRCMEEDINLILLPEENRQDWHETEEYVCGNCKGKESEGDITKVISNISSKWIITDVRFPNEVKAIKDKSGIIIRVNRGDGNTGDHPSETALDNYQDWNYVIDNNGSIEDLIEKVRDILQKENLL